LIRIGRRECEKQGKEALSGLGSKRAMLRRIGSKATNRSMMFRLAERLFHSVS